MHRTIKQPALLQLVKVPYGKAALRYEQKERRQFRDCLLFYCDGRVSFERYCYGEAAGRVFLAWVQDISPIGEVYYALPLENAVVEKDLPGMLEVLPDGRLRTDGKANLWALAAVLPTDEKNGYGWLKAHLPR